MREGLRRLAVVGVLAIVATAAADTRPDGLVLAERLAATNRADVERAIADIEAAPVDTPYLDEALREAARACEDVLADPARALALYERILRDFPHGSASRVARVRAATLRERVGAGNAHAREAAELAQLVTTADTLAAGELLRRGDALAAADWPGAPDAALFVAEWLQRVGRTGEARTRYDAIATRWPGSPQAFAAQRGAVATAIIEHDWSRAEQLANGLPAVDETDRVLRDELLEKIARGRRFDFWYRIAWCVLIASLLALVASLAEAIARRGRPRLKPPVEVMYLFPVGAVLVGVALTTHQAVAPAVLVLSIGGLVLAWLSGITLELARARKHYVPRAAIHVLLCFAAVAALLYIVLTHDDLLEMMIETVRFGPDP